MKNFKSSKRTVLLSALALLLCVSMLVGSTFAWFTDSVASAGNIIKSGKLDVTMEWADGKEAPDAATWTDASTGAIFNYDKWEPGYVDVRHIKIANIGTLALKYQLSITTAEAVSELADVIDVYYADPAVQVADRAALAGATKLGTLAEVLGQFNDTAAGNLLPNENHTITIALKMQENAGNDYQELSIGAAFSVQLVATQLTAEIDSFDDQYDVGAPYDLPGGVGIDDFGANVAYANGAFYASFKGALEALHENAEAGVVSEPNVLYLKPGADLGNVTHAHVCSDITIYGNGAYISGGEADIEVDTYKYCHSGSKVCAGVIDDLTVNIYDVKGIAVWGQRTTEVTMNINLYNCEDISRVYISGTMGVNNVNIVDSSFDGTNGYFDTAVYTNNPGTINLTNTTIKAYSVGLNQNNKSEGTQNINLTNCTFIDCATADTCGSAAAYAAPVRVVATEYASAVSNLALNGCQFVYTTANKAVDGDILTLDKRAGKVNNGTVNVTVNGAPMDGILVGTQEALQNALTNAANGDKIVLVNDVTVTEALAMNKSVTLDLRGNTLYISTTDDSKIGGGVNVTIKNGNVDISGTNFTERNGIFNFQGGAGNTLTIEDVNFYGEGYTCYSVFWIAKSNSGTPNTLNLVDSNFELKNEADSSGGFIKHPSGVENCSAVNITNSVIDFENVTRLFLYGVYNIKDSEISFVDTTGEANGFRQGQFVIDNSKVTISGGDKGISPKFADTVIKNGSVVTISNVTGNDVIFEADYDIIVDSSSTFTYSSVSGTSGGQVIVQ